jgi:hypothetical protein
LNGAADQEPSTVIALVIATAINEPEDYISIALAPDVSRTKEIGLVIFAPVLERHPGPQPKRDVRENRLSGDEPALHISTKMRIPGAADHCFEGFGRVGKSFRNSARLLVRG